MSDTPFYKTLMGLRFFESLMPELVAQLKALNVNLGRIAKALELAQASTTPTGE